MLLTLRQYAPHIVSRWLWNWAFAHRGRGWHEARPTTGDFLYPVLTRALHGGSILDLGCGLGTTAAELPPESFTQYVGVDFSAVAIAKAQARQIPRATFQVGAIETYQPTARFDVILFRESLYYLSPPAALRALDHYRPWLTEDGVFVIRLCNRTTHAAVITALHADGLVIAQIDHPVGPTILIRR